MLLERMAGEPSGDHVQALLGFVLWSSVTTALDCCKSEVIGIRPRKPCDLGVDIPRPPLILHREAERADPRLGADEGHNHVVIAAINQTPVASAGEAPVILHAAPDILGVWRAVVASQPQRNRSLVDTQSCSYRPVVCPYAGQPVSCILQKITLDKIN